MSSSRSNESKLDMITRTIPAWHQSLIDAFRTPRDLADHLGLDLAQLGESTDMDTGFSMLVPKGFASRMEKQNPNDPLLLQVLPRQQELEANSEYTTDPVGDSQATVVPGLLHKYHGRALLITTGACSIHCRYCFRRHFPYPESNACGNALEPALDYLRSHQDITEVILSGGDPLMQSDGYLSDVISQLESIPHLQRLRIHSRIPISLPERITAELSCILSGSRLQTIMVVHCNHANEIDQTVIEAIEQLRKSEMVILNQSVLLKGVNDDIQALADLCTRLFSSGVMPYYLHLLDQVEGATHFEVKKDVAGRLFQNLQERLPGYMVPKLVHEIPGAKSKTQLTA